MPFCSVKSFDFDLAEKKTAFFYHSITIILRLIWLIIRNQPDTVNQPHQPLDSPSQHWMSSTWNTYLAAPLTCQLRLRILSTRPTKTHWMLLIVLGCRVSLRLWLWYDVGLLVVVSWWWQTPLEQSLTTNHHWYCWLETITSKWFNHDSWLINHHQWVVAVFAVVSQGTHPWVHNSPLCGSDLFVMTWNPFSFRTSSRS